MITQIHIPRTAGRAIRTALYDLGYTQDGSHKKVSDYTEKDTIFFSVVRNPFTRFESIWRNHVPEISFKEFVNKVDSYVLYAPQVNWIDSTVEILRYENLNVDWFRFCKKHNLKPIALAYIGMSFKKDIPWTTETIAKVAEYYKEDFKK